MDKFLIGCLAVVCIFVMICLLFVGTIIGVLGKDASLRSGVEAFQHKQEACFDTMYKVINQKAKLPKAAKEDLLKLLPEIMSGRQGGSLVKSIQEKYPDFNLSLYRDLSRTIEAERNQFLRAQNELFDIKREHDTLLRKPISGLVLSVFGRKPIEIVVVSSTNAKEVVKTGVEDNFNQE